MSLYYLLIFFFSTYITNLCSHHKAKEIAAGSRSHKNTGTPSGSF